MSKQQDLVERYHAFCLRHRIPYLTAAHYNLANLVHLGLPATIADGTVVLLPNAYTHDPGTWEANKIATYKTFAHAAPSY